MLSVSWYLLIAQLQKRTSLATDATIAVVFAGSLAIGAALTPEEDLIEALFGKFQPLSFFAFCRRIAGNLPHHSLRIPFQR
jgi:ABC-type Mn2+/Zn2+ transport system permease subunit